MPAVIASFLVANWIVKAKKPFVIGKALVLPAAKDICHELLGDADVQKMAHVPLWLSPKVSKRAGDTVAHLLERTKEKLRYAT